MDIAILGGGCFWCLEAVYEQVRGVRSVVSGYMGGHVANPTYEQVCGKQTGHAEVVRIEFDPTVVGYDDLLEIFFTIHDPTTLNRQGNDLGPQYRSIIFTTTPEQRACAQSVLRILNGSASDADRTCQWAERFSSMAFDVPLVTELIDVGDDLGGAIGQQLAGRPDAAKRFWPAEPEHQHYFQRHPSQGYCHFVVAPKVAKAQAHFSRLMRDAP